MLPLPPSEAFSAKPVLPSNKNNKLIHLPNDRTASSAAVSAKKRERDKRILQSLVYLSEVETTNSACWAALAPLVRESPQDARIQCDKLVKPFHFEHVARYLSDQIANWFVDNEQQQEQRYQAILSSLSCFSWYCHQTLQVSKIAGFKLRTAAAYGAKATGCPAWHADNVPVRAIQTLYGPGTLVIDPLTTTTNDDNSFLRRMLQPTLHNNPNDLDVVDVVEWKDRLLKESGVVPGQVPAGILAALVGHTWKEAAATPEAALHPVLHKSPSPIPDDQGRVLLVLDVVLSESACTDDCCN